MNDSKHRVPYAIPRESFPAADSPAARPQAAPHSAAGQEAARMHAPFIPPALRGLPTIQVDAPGITYGRRESVAEPSSSLAHMPTPLSQPAWLSRDADVDELSEAARGTSGQAETELPWIDAFTADHEVAALSGEVESHDVALPEVEARDAASRDAASRDDVWPLDEAGEQVTELANDISAHDVSSYGALSGHSDAQSSLGDMHAHFVDAETDDAAQNGVTPALPMWNEDEWMDIMPPASNPTAHDRELTDARSTDSAFTSDVANEVHAAELRASDLRAAELRAAELHNAELHDAELRNVELRRQESEACAVALEGLAQRLRTGELPLLGYQSQRGDAAALAAALASLLGVREQ